MVEWLKSFLKPASSEGSLAIKFPAEFVNGARGDYLIKKCCHFQRHEAGRFRGWPIRGILEHGFDTLLFVEWLYAEELLYIGMSCLTGFDDEGIPAYGVDAAVGNSNSQVLLGD